MTDAERFRSLVAQRLGLHFDDGKLAWLDEVLQRRSRIIGRSAGDYLAHLEGDELRALAPELTVGETYFFRNYDQFRAFTEVALTQGARTMRILSAGCSSGEEAYSLAMLAQERPEMTFSIRAVDVNPLVLEKARKASYSAWSLRETPAPAQARWFHADGRDFTLDARIRAAVGFEERNLTADDAELWRPGAYNVVFCRNVLMYLTPESAAAVMARITRSLVPGGHLFLGHAETLRGLSADYHLCHTHETFYYRRKDHIEVEIAPTPAAPPSVSWTSTWIDAVQHAAERIRALSEDSPQESLPPRRASSFEINLAFELLAEERFAEALQLVGRLPAEIARNPDVLLLRAALLTHSGQLEPAERACAELLAIDELNAGSHYLLALCREGAGDRAGALEHDQVASYLDGSFAMPRLHSGLMARRTGDRAAARRELAQAISLLEREDPPRLLLFGGGFSREALIALCRAELEALA